LTERPVPRKGKKDSREAYGKAALQGGRVGTAANKGKIPLSVKRGED